MQNKTSTFISKSTNQYEGEKKMTAKVKRKSINWTARTAGGRYHIFALVAASLILAVTVCACSNGSNLGVGARFGSGTIVSEERPADDFDSVFVRGSGTVFLTQGEAVSVVVETDDNLISRVYTEVRGGTLELSYASGPFGTHLRPTQGYNYHITVVDLENITIRGSADVFVDSVVAEQLDLEVTGSGQIDIENIRADEVRADITGSGEITLSGEADTQQVSVTGSGTFDGHDFEGKYVKVSNKGSGTATVWATVELDASIAGKGDILYYGDVVPDMSNGSGEALSLGNR
ncbi:head GIN domain-containing protein [Chloroflexota bacterium]